MDIPNLSPAEALVMATMREHAETLLPAGTVQMLAPQFERAAEVLSSQSANRLASWKKCIRVLARGPRLTPPAVGREVQRVVYEAVLLGLRIQARYSWGCRPPEQGGAAGVGDYALTVAVAAILAVATSRAVTRFASGDATTWLLRSHVDS